jgi:Nucleoside diphosphate kinase
VNVDDLLAPPLTTDPDRRRIYPDDVYFREIAGQLDGLAPGQLTRLLEHNSFLMFKPEAVTGRRMQRALAFLAGQGFEPLGTLRVRIDPRTLRELWRYQINAIPLAAVRAVDMTLQSGESLVVALHDTHGPQQTGAPAAVRLSNLKGSSSNFAANKGLLRGELECVCESLNFVHAPDEPADLLRELAVLVDRPRRAEVIELLAGLPTPAAQAEVEREIRELYQAYPEHPMNLAASLDALRAAAVDRPDRAAPTAQVIHAIEHRAAQDELLRLVDWLDYHPGDLALWDRITLAAYLAGEEVSDRLPLIGPTPGARAEARRDRASAAKADRSDIDTDQT